MFFVLTAFYFTLFERHSENLFHVDFYQITRLDGNELTAWINSLKKTPATLQHLARIAVRRGIQSSVHYSVRQLDLPRRLQKYLVLADECSDNEMLQAGLR